MQFLIHYRPLVFPDKSPTDDYILFYIHLPNHMIETLSIIFISMVIGQVWIILIQPEYILDWIGKYIDMAIRFPRLHKLLTCSVCMAGQAALWIYPASLAVKCSGYPACFFIFVRSGSPFLHCYLCDMGDGFGQ